MRDEIHPVWSKQETLPATRQFENQPPLVSQDSVASNHTGGDRTPKGFGVLGLVNAIAGKLLGKFLKVLLRQGNLIFAPSRESQEQLGERPEIVADDGGLLHLRHAALLVAVDSAEPKDETSGTGK